MRRNSTHRIAIIRSAALALLALSIFELQILAENPLAGAAVARLAATPGVINQNDDGVVLLFSSLPGAIARGQTLRVSFANLIHLDGRDQNPVEVRARVKLFDAHGGIISQTAEVMVTTNQFRSFDFNRDRLPQPGEERTGRLQVREELTVHLKVNKIEALVIKQKVLEFLPASSELVDNASGESQSANPCLPMSIWLQAQSAPNQNTFGLAYGQTLRFSALNPNEAGPSGEPIRVRIRLADSHGTVIAQSAEVTIPAGEFHSFDFNRNDLHLPGEPGTGRLQVAWIVDASVQGTSARQFTISVETLDNTAASPRPTTRIGYAYLAVPLTQG